MMDIEKLKTNLFLRAFGILKVPMLAFASPTLVEMTDHRCVLKIPLNYRTKNHLKVMYFGALNVGAEACVGLVAVDQIKKSGKRIDFLFRDFKATFLRRSEAEVHFICDEVAEIIAAIKNSEQSTERINKLIKAYAIVPSINPSERVAEFELTLSVKKRA